MNKQKFKNNEKKNVGDEDAQEGQYTGESSSWGHETSQDDGKAVLYESVLTPVRIDYQNLST